MNARAFTAACLLAGINGCAEPPESTASGDRLSDDPAAAILTRELQRIDAELARIDSVFQPLPLLRPAQEAALTRFGNAQQLARARALGIDRLAPASRIAELQRAGTLVALEDSEYWVVRDMEHSQPLAVPAVHALLTEIGTRFQARLRDLGVPAYRMEVTSVLRSAEDQAALRRVNPNAATGESTHEYGTTIDVLYSAFAAPAEPVVRPELENAVWLEPHLLHCAAIAAERVAARRALELKSVLAAVLLELQNEGRVMVTLERLQPVFHMTVATAPQQ